MATILKSVRIRVENDHQIQEIVNSYAEQGIQKKYNAVVNEILAQGLHGMQLPPANEGDDES